MSNVGFLTYFVGMVFDPESVEYDVVSDDDDDDDYYDDGDEMTTTTMMMMTTRTKTTMSLKMMRSLGLSTAIRMAQSINAIKRLAKSSSGGRLCRTQPTLSMVLRMLCSVGNTYGEWPTRKDTRRTVVSSGNGHLSGVFKLTTATKT